MYLGFYGFSDPDQQMLHAGSPQTGKMSMPVFGGAGGSAPNLIDPGFDPGFWSPSCITRYTSELFMKLYADGWRGVCFDFEEGGVGVDVALGDLTVEMIINMCKRAKTAGLKVMITTSHTAPYGFPLGVDGFTSHWTRSWIESSYVDFFSPQMYTSGTVYEPDMSPGTTVYMINNSMAELVPSIPGSMDATLMKAEFSNSKGYVVWDKL
jgi:hypothetical protein